MSAFFTLKSCALCIKQLPLVALLLERWQRKAPKMGIEVAEPALLLAGLATRLSPCCCSVCEVCSLLLLQLTCDRFSVCKHLDCHLSSHCINGPRTNASVLLILCHAGHYYHSLDGQGQGCHKLLVLVNASAASSDICSIPNL